MTKEQEEAIKICSKITGDDLLNCWEGGEKEYKAIQVVLKLIEKQKAEIEKQKAEIKKKDKIIDLMLKDKYENIDMLQMAYTGKEVNYDLIKLFSGISDEEAIKIIKQYFENQAKM